jgi:hypothetical protein
MSTDCEKRKITLLESGDFIIKEIHTLEKKRLSTIILCIHSFFKGIKREIGKGKRILSDKKVLLVYRFRFEYWSRNFYDTV